ncbi:Bicupin, oxalate decarboxylase/oxidase [Auricularia subglabra TFB-10046 SS5]|nr:Bicupin, oxalate decarboxylase/oxidase [Auricularia subglabra TFB-10046 SS5]
MFIILRALAVVAIVIAVAGSELEGETLTIRSKHLRIDAGSVSPPRVVKRQTGRPQPISPDGSGAPLLGGTNSALDAQQPDNLVPPSTDHGAVPNLKWAFSDSHMRLFNGGWIREQTVTDLPPSKDISAVQQHIRKGATRELHWHRVSEWGILTHGSVLLTAVDENGKNAIWTLNVGDIWYFPKGSGHAIQGLADENEFLLVFDDGDFDRAGTTFNVDDWLTHIPPDVLLKNFGLNSSSADTFANVPEPDPVIGSGNVTATTTVPPSPNGELSGAGSYVYFLSQKSRTEVPGGGGTLDIVDSRNFPIATTIASAIITLKPKGLRELHWHPNADEWLYFHKGAARATVFLGGSLARTFDFTAGDTAVFPDNSGHYIENTSDTEDLVWFEIYKSDRVADVSLTQWLALTPADLVSQMLNVSLDFVRQLKTEKQLLLV